MYPPLAELSIKLSSPKKINALPNDSSAGTPVIPLKTSDSPAQVVGEWYPHVSTHAMVKAWCGMVIHPIYRIPGIPMARNKSAVHLILLVISPLKIPAF